MRPVVCLELNEVPWRILDWWVQAHPSSAAAGLLDDAHQLTTVAADDGHLSPWVTWPTVHRGVPNGVHGIGHFGQDTAHADAVAAPWWDVASDAGRRVGLFGLLHTAPLPAHADRFAFWVPDTFASTDDTHPDTLRPFQAFNLAMARASARNVSSGIDVAGAARFLARAPRLGLRPATVAGLARQLFHERRNPDTRVRRRSFQSVLAFDLFLGQVRRARPDAAAFFTNHVASAMHRYWAATFPTDYPPESFAFDDAWIARWNGELAEAFGHADRMVGRLVDHCDRVGADLVVVSSMGQQAAQGTPVGRQLYLRDVDALVGAAGLDPRSVERRPAMDPQVNVVVADGDAERFAAWLARLTVGGSGVDVDRDGSFFSLTFGQADDAIGDVAVDGHTTEPAALGLEIVEIEDEVASTGYHVPEGTLLWRPAGGATSPDRARREVPTTAVAPFLLELLDVPSPSYMTAAGRIELPGLAGHTRSP